METSAAARCPVHGASRLEPASLRSTGIYARVDSATMPRLFGKLRRVIPGSGCRSRDFHIALLLDDFSRSNKTRATEVATTPPTAVAGLIGAFRPKLR